MAGGACGATFTAVGKYPWFQDFKISRFQDIKIFVIHMCLTFDAALHLLFEILNTIEQHIRCDLNIKPHKFNERRPPDKLGLGSG